MEVGQTCSFGSGLKGLKTAPVLTGLSVVRLEEVSVSSEQLDV